MNAQGMIHFGIVNFFGTIDHARPGEKVRGTFARPFEIDYELCSVIYPKGVQRLCRVPVNEKTAPHGLDSLKYIMARWRSR